MSNSIILVVDDDEGIRETLTSILSLNGYSTYSASNGLAAIELLKNIRSPCVILLDLMMPVMNGAEFIQALKERLPTDRKIPIVLLTAFGNSFRQMGVEVDVFLSKPFNLDTILEVVRRFCGP